METSFLVVTDEATEAIITTDFFKSVFFKLLIFALIFGKNLPIFLVSSSNMLSTVLNNFFN